MINSTIHTFVVFKLGQEGVSQAALAKLCGCSPAMINYIITGRKKTPSIRAKVAANMGFKDWKQLEQAANYFQDIVRASAYTREVSNA